MASTRLGYLAVKKQTNNSTPLKPTHFIRYKGGDLSLNQEIIENNPIQANRHSAIQPVPGKADADGDFDLDLDVNEAPFFLYGALGAISSSDISSETDASVFRHDITVANELPSFTFEQAKGNITDTTNNRQNYSVERTFGVKVNTLTLSGQEGIVNMKAGLVGLGQFLKAGLVEDAAAGSSVEVFLEQVEGLTTDDTVNIFDVTPQNETDAIAAIDSVAKSIDIATLGGSYTVANGAKVELVPQTPSFSLAPKVFSFVHASFQFGTDLTDAAGNDREAIENWELSIDNQIEKRYGSLRATPSSLGEKGVKFAMKYQKFFESVEDRDRYLNQTKQACILTLEFPTSIISGTDTNQAKHKIKIEMSDVRFTKYDLPTGTDELYAVQIETVPFYDSGDGRAVRVRVENGLVGTTYTA
jgi:hypothetical protein